MKHSASRLATLSRVQRLRAIEQRQARAKMADALVTRERMAGLAARSKSLLANHEPGQGALRADELAVAYQFQTGMRQLASSAQDISRDADNALDLAGTKLAAAEHRLDHLNKRITQESRLISASRLAKTSSQSSGLARSLLKQEAKHSKPETGDLR